MAAARLRPWSTWRFRWPGLAAELEGSRSRRSATSTWGPHSSASSCRRIVHRVNRMGADMVAITGDVVDAACGISRITPSRWRAPVRARNLRRHRQPRVLLRRERVDRRAAAAGHARACSTSTSCSITTARSSRWREVTDYSRGTSMPRTRAIARAAAEMPADTPRVLLAHQPRSAPSAAQAGYDSSYPATRTAGNSGHGISSCGCNSRSPPG